MDLQETEKFLRELYSSLKKSQDRWCSDCVDDAEEMWEEYPDFINSTISKIEGLLGIPQSGLVISSAFYGAGEKIVDVTEILKSYCNSKTLSITINNKNMGGDPAPGVKKKLSLMYSVDSEEIQHVLVPEDCSLKLP